MPFITSVYLCGSEDDSRYPGMAATHEQAIATFKQFLPSTLARRSSLDRQHELIVVQSLTEAAVICLHKGVMWADVNSLMKCLSASNSIVRSMVGVTLQQINYVDPVLAVRGRVSSSLYTLNQI